MKRNMLYLMTIALWLFFGAFIFFTKEFSFTWLSTIKLEDLGLFGDSYNMLTSLFAGLAFVAVYHTLDIQKSEFNHQHEIMRLEQFNNRFFQMLEIFNNVRKDIYTFSCNDIKKGEMIFEILAEKLINHFAEVDIENLKDLEDAYESFNEEYNLCLKYYFLNLYQVLNYIENDYPSKDEKQKKKYANIVRAQLSQNELFLLFYNGVGIVNIVGSEYKSLIEKYNFFEHVSIKSMVFVKGVDFETVIGQESFHFAMKEYAPCAFGKNKEFLKLNKTQGLEVIGSKHKS
jgi:hypothetical protein